MVDIRRFIQIFSSIAANADFKGFFTGNIYRGNLKSFCYPGLNCYSCPGALGACPIGSLQALILSPFYVLGFLILIGTLLGRFICGFLCPFGLFQELLHSIPSKKLLLKRTF